MNSKPNLPSLTDADLDRALSPASDSILPSSGFATSVMAAVNEQASAPAPIPFPWKRAIPGLLAIIAALALLAAALPAALKSAMAAVQQPATVTHWQTAAPSLAHGSDATWITASLILCLACLFFCRRLIAR
jgi:hypothetical protein